jgi:hypothetical protein
LQAGARRSPDALALAAAGCWVIRFNFLMTQINYRKNLGLKYLNIIGIFLGATSVCASYSVACFFA